MAFSVFGDKAMIPSDVILAAVLTDFFPVWEALLGEIKRKYEGATCEWKYYGKAAGWSYQVKLKKRTLIYLTPTGRFFRARIVLGEAAAAKVARSDLPEEIKATINAATPYIEGRGIDIDIHDLELLDTVMKLLKIKLEA